MNDSPHYEDQPWLESVRRWRDAPPASVGKSLPKVSVPSIAAVRSAVPERLTEKLLAGAYTAALRSSRPRQLLRAAEVDELAQIATLPLGQQVQLAARERRSARLWGGGSGTALGLAGAIGLAADAPVLVVLALRTTLRIGYCFGEPASPTLAAAIFALASADKPAEKKRAWDAALRAGDIHEDAVRDGLERAAEREFAKQALNASLQRLAQMLTQRFGLKRPIGFLPVVGAALGGAANAEFLALVAEAAQQVMLARRLISRGYSLTTQPSAAAPLATSHRGTDRLALSATPAPKRPAMKPAKGSTKAAAHGSGTKAAPAKPRRRRRPDPTP